MAEAIRRMVNGTGRGKSKSRIGLDVGSTSIKIVEFSGTAEKPALVSFGATKILGSSKEGVADSIKSLAESINITSKDASISVSGPSLIVRLISMPKMTDEELSGAVRFEAEKFIPFDINDCIIDFQILNKGSKDKSGTEILLAAAKRDHVLSKVKTAESAGFSVRTVDVDIFAVINSFLKNYVQSGQPKTAALLNIGASSTSLSILYGGLPVFVREIASGGGAFSAAIAKNMNITQEAAEELKMAPKDKAEEVLSAVKPAIGNLLNEVRLSFGYYENQSGRSIDEIYVSGGCAIMTGLEDSFQEAFGSKPRYWDPFGFLGSAPQGAARPEDAVKGSYAVAVGLALR